MPRPDLPSNERKQVVRRERWRALQRAGAARFPGAMWRIPNFTGAEAAADRLAGERVWRRAEVLKCNPDLPQRPVRFRALRAGKRIVMALPRLREKAPFLLLDPERIPEERWWDASSIAGASELGRPLTLGRIPPVDLIVCGSVAVAPDGSRLGKGGGYADLEYGLLRETKRIGARTPIVTTVHTIQVVAAGDFPVEIHDVAVDLFVTPNEVVRCPRTHPRPKGVLWCELLEEMRLSIPVLGKGRLRQGVGKPQARAAARSAARVGSGSR